MRSEIFWTASVSRARAWRITKRACLAQLGETQGAVTCVGRVGFENHAFDLFDQAIRRPARGAKVLDKLLREVACAFERCGSAGVAAVESTGYPLSAAPLQPGRSIPKVFPGTRQEGRPDPVVPIPNRPRYSVATGRHHFREGRLARSAGPDDRDQAGVERYVCSAYPLSVLDGQCGDNLGRHGCGRGFATDVGPRPGINAGLAEGVESEVALDPRIAVFSRLAPLGRRMGVRAVQTWL